MILLMFFVCIALAILQKRTRHSRILKEDEPTLKQQHSPRVSKSYDKYIDAYVKKNYGDNAKWQLKSDGIHWSECMKIRLLIINQELENEVVISKNAIVLAYNETIHPKEFKKPEPKEENVADKWIYTHLPQINIQISKLLQTNTTKLSYPCNIEFKYKKELLDKLCDCTEYDFRLQGDKIIIDFEVYKVACCGN